MLRYILKIILYGLFYSELQWQNFCFKIRKTQILLSNTST